MCVDRVGVAENVPRGKQMTAEHAIGQYKWRYVTCCPAPGNMQRVARDGEFLALSRFD